MLPSPNSCVACDRPFPANGELVSMPHGRRIAVDPELGRVWRICTKCGEWNLLGVEAAREAVPELRARVAAVPVADQTAVAGLVKVGGVEILELRSQTGRAAENQQLRTTMVRRRANWLAAGSLLLTLSAIGLLAITRPSISSSGPTWFGFPFTFPIIGSAMIVASGMRAGSICEVTFGSSWAAI